MTLSSFWRPSWDSLRKVGTDEKRFQVFGEEAMQYEIRHILCGCCNLTRFVGVIENPLKTGVLNSKSVASFGIQFFFSLICLFWGVMPPSRGECGLILLEMLGIAPEWDVTSLCGKSGLFSLFFAGPCFLLLLCLSSRWVEAWWTQSLLIDTGSENDLAYLDNQSGIWWSSLKRKPINYQWSPFLGAIYLFLINHWQ